MPAKKAPVVLVTTFEDTDVVINNIIAQKRRRDVAVKAMISLTNQMVSLLRFLSGWHKNWNNLDKNGQKKLNEETKKIVTSMIQEYKKDENLSKRGPKNPIPKDMRQYSPDLYPFIVAYIPIEEERKRAEKEMVNEVTRLPVFEWFQSIPGIAELATATIIGEAGNLHNYATVSKLWKRMGLAVINGERQGSNVKGNKEKAIAHGYNRQRRSAMYVIGDSVMKKRNTHPNEYGDRYDRERARAISEHPDWVNPKDGRSKHAHLHAQRIMEKEILKDAWKQWRNLMPQPPVQ